MFRIREAIVVEGRYDKKHIVPGGGHGDSGDRRLWGSSKIRSWWPCCGGWRRSEGSSSLTDSDGAGFLIRSRLKSALPQDRVKHAYIPDVYGKERRKRAPGKEGKLGVEGMTPAVLVEVLRRAGATFLEEGEGDRGPKGGITKADLYALGLSGGPDAARRRQALLKHLKLPEHMSANALLLVLNALYDRESFLEEAATWR